MCINHSSPNNMGTAASRAGSDAASNVNARNVDFDVNGNKIEYDVNGNKIEYDFNGNRIQYDVNGNVAFSPDDPGNWTRVDMTSATNRKNVVDSIKKMESDSYTAQFKDIITESSFYKNNKGKLATMGLTVTAVAGWFGVLLAMGYSPAEAWAKMLETVNNWVDAFAGLGGDIVGAGLNALWDAFVKAVHNAVGHKFFETEEGTEKALISFLVFLVMYKILGFFGINLVTLPFKLVGGVFKKKN